MLFMIENHAIRWSSRLLRRCFSKTLDVPSSCNAEELMSHSNQNLTSASRENEKCLKIAMLGAPNVGKSTLVNQLIKRSVIIKISNFLLFVQKMKKQVGGIRK